MAVKKDPILLPFTLAGHGMPGIWRYMVPQEVLDLDFPQEKKSACGSCPQICLEGFDKTYRCCSYYPEVANFLLGLALKDTQGSREVHKLLQMGFLLPEGFQNTPRQWIDYLADCSEDGFGQAKRVRCPMLQKKTGYCGIYAFRNSVCSTFFCINDHGDKGSKLWNAVEEMVCQVETSLCQWALDEVGFDNQAYIQRVNSLAPRVSKLHDPATGGWNKETLEFLWAEYYGKELDLFRLCAEAVSDNRDRLWDIANENEIIEAAKYNHAMIKSVPKRYQDEIEDSDLEESSEDDEYLSPDDLLKALLKKHRKVYRLPNRLRLSKRARVVENPKKDKEQTYYQKYPYMVELLKKKGGKKIESRDFLTAKQAEWLGKMKGGKKLETLATRQEFSGIDEDFLQQWHSKGILEKV